MWMQQQLDRKYLASAAAPIWHQIFQRSLLSICADDVRVHQRTEEVSILLLFPLLPTTGNRQEVQLTSRCVASSDLVAV